MAGQSCERSNGPAYSFAQLSTATEQTKLAGWSFLCVPIKKQAGKSNEK